MKPTENLHYIIEHIKMGYTLNAPEPVDLIYFLEEIDSQVIELEKARDALLEAAENALEWINAFGFHAPIIWGGEEGLANILRAAISRAKG